MTKTCDLASSVYVRLILAFRSGLHREGHCPSVAHGIRDRPRIFTSRRLNVFECPGRDVLVGFTSWASCGPDLRYFPAVDKGHGASLECWQIAEFSEFSGAWGSKSSHIVRVSAKSFCEETARWELKSGSQKETTISFLRQAQGFSGCSGGYLRTPRF